MNRYVIDTHALLWYATGDTRIGKEAKAVIEQCEAGMIEIVVPAIVLIESISTIQNPKKGLSYDANILLDWLSNHRQFIISNIDLQLARLFNQNIDSLRTLRDDHDRLIVVTSRLFDNAPIITRADDIRAIASTIW